MSNAGKFAWGFILLLAILHWDFWFWSDRTLLFGFMPIGLAYQAGISLAAALGWAMVIKYAWPSDVERWADEGSDNGGEA